MPPDPYPDPGPDDPGPDDAEPDGFPPAEDAPGLGQGLYVTLPAVWESAHLRRRAASRHLPIKITATRLLP